MSLCTHETDLTGLLHVNIMSSAYRLDLKPKTGISLSSILVLLQIAVVPKIKQYVKVRLDIPGG